MQKDIFDRRRLPPFLDEFIRRMNPWWQGKRGMVLPEFRRWTFNKTLSSLVSGRSPITVVRGPRQVGKSTMQDQIIEHLLYNDHVSPNRILKVQFDEIKELIELDVPVLSMAWWFEDRILGKTFNEAARANEPAYLLFDEVQNIKDWAPSLKSLADSNSIRVLVTGSSALRIEAGRDSLAGRINPIELGPLMLREVAELGLGEPLPPLLPDNGIDALTKRDTWISLQQHGTRNKTLRDAAFTRWSARGGYPRAQEQYQLPWSDAADGLIETVVNRAIQHDLRQGEVGRKRDESLLKEVFRLVCRYTGQPPSQAVFVEDIKSSLGANIGWQRLSAYLRFLEGAMLLRLIPPLELRLKRKRGAPKLCVCDHGLRAAWMQELIPLDVPGLLSAPHLADLAGHIAESVVGYFLSSIPHLDLSHFPERGPEPEVDYVITIGDKRIPLEVKYRRRINSHADTYGLRAFMEKSVYNAPFGVLVTLDDDVTIDDPRVVPVSLASLLLLR